MSAKLEQNLVHVTMVPYVALLRQTLELCLRSGIDVMQFVSETTNYRKPDKRQDMDIQPEMNARTSSSSE